MGAAGERAQVSASAPEATGNDSRGRPQDPDAQRVQRYALLLRAVLAVAGVVGGLLLVLATTATIIEISIGTTGETASGIDTVLTGADRHGPALIIIAVFAMAMLAGAVQGARPAMLALAAAGVIVLGIAIISDAQNIDDTGEIGQLYTEAIAGAGNGFYFETLGGALLLISGGGMLVLGSGAPVERKGRGERPRRKPPALPSLPWWRRGRDAAGDAEASEAAAGAEPEPGRPARKPADDWFSDG